MSPINNTLAAATNFLQQLVVAKVSKHHCRSHRFLFVCCSRALIVYGVNRLRRSSLRSPEGFRGYGGQVPTSRGYSFVVEQTKTFKKTGWANFWRCVSRDFCSARSANGGGSLHSDTNFTN